MSPGLCLPCFHPVPVPPSRPALPRPIRKFRLPAAGMTRNTPGQAPSSYRPPVFIFRTLPRRQGDSPEPRSESHKLLARILPPEADSLSLSSQNNTDLDSLLDASHRGQHHTQPPSNPQISRTSKQQWTTLMPFRRPTM